MNILNTTSEKANCQFHKYIVPDIINGPIQQRFKIYPMCARYISEYPLSHVPLSVELDVETKSLESPLNLSTYCTQ